MFQTCISANPQLKRIIFLPTFKIEGFNALYISLQSNQALRQGEVLSREQLQFLTLGGQGELADPERKELIQKVNNLLKVSIKGAVSLRFSATSKSNEGVGMYWKCT